MAGLRDYMTPILLIECDRCAIDGQYDAGSTLIAEAEAIRNGWTVDSEGFVMCPRCNGRHV
jgi:hypothetical protein